MGPIGCSRQYMHPNPMGGNLANEPSTESSRASGERVIRTTVASTPFSLDRRALWTAFEIFRWSLLPFSAAFSWFWRSASLTCLESHESACGQLTAPVVFTRHLPHPMGTARRAPMHIGFRCAPLRRPGSRHNRNSGGSTSPPAPEFVLPGQHRVERTREQVAPERWACPFPSF